MTLVADALGARRIPSACSTRHVPTVRRSCHPMPGPTGLPVARSQTTSRPVGWRCRRVDRSAPGEGGSGHRKDGAAIWSPSNSTRPGAGVSGEPAHDVRAEAPSDARSPNAPPRCRRRRPGRCPPAAHAQGAGPNGEERPNLPGFKIPAGSKARLEAGAGPRSPARGHGHEPGAVEPDAMVVADRRAPWAEWRQ